MFKRTKLISMAAIAALLGSSITIATAARVWLERCTLLVEKGEMERSTRQQYKSHVDHIAASSIGKYQARPADDASGHGFL